MPDKTCTNMATKRTHDDSPYIPEGFKLINEDSEKPKLVFNTYHSFHLVKVPVQQTWFDNMADDPEPKRFTIKVMLSDLEEKDIQVIRKVDEALAEGAALKGAKHSPLVKDGILKLKAKMKLSARRKSSISKGSMLLTGHFLLTSVYYYEATNYYGINLFVSDTETKKPGFHAVTKSSKKDEEVPAKKDEEVPAKKDEEAE